MPPWYKGKPKTPGELVSKTQAAVQLLATAQKEKETEKAAKDAAEYIALLVQCLLGNKAAAPDKPSPGDVQATLTAVLRSDVLPLMVSNLHKLPFESRKDVVEVFTFACKYSPSPGGQPGLEYLRQRTHLLRQLVRGYEDTAIALNCGEMVRTAVSRDAALATSVLNSECLEMFFRYVQKNALEASDAFNTFKALLVTHKEVTVAYLSHGDNYDAFFRQYEELLRSPNYATQRQALTLLATLLMDTFTGAEALLFRYIKSANNLMTIMNLLRAKSRSIQFEAFHVFKVFVANPHKPELITGILVSNKEKLLRFLKNFLQERAEDDETFAAEKADIMAELTALEQAPGYRMRPSASMHRNLTTSMSFSALPDGGDSTGRLPDGAGASGPVRGAGGGGEGAADRELDTGRLAEAGSDMPLQ